MEIKKETKIIPMTTDGQALRKGDSVVFNAEGRCFAGIFLGVSSRGSVMFEGIIQDANVRFNVMPKSIGCIYRAGIKTDRVVPK